VDDHMRWLTGILLSTVVWPLLVNEFAEWCPRFGEWVIRRAARRLTKEHRERYEWEWLGELDAVPGKLSKLVFALGVFRRRKAMAEVLKGDAELSRLNGRQILKRAFDLVMASTALVVTLPLWAAIAVAIRLSSPGPVFFNQERVTKDGRVFRMHKFRTMRVDVDSPVDASTPFFKLQADPRLTPVGRVLRRLSLDELPQFWNVLMGEMSLVGPRPLPADLVAANLELLSPRHEVPAGITGWWQVSGRRAVTPEEAVQLDLFYVQNWSLTLDLYILLKTFVAVLIEETTRKYQGESK
jgi:lipopolysaccharide/colanic/teichoic acid biosynthesis glycosyltransferase